MSKDFCSSAKTFLTNQPSNPTITILKCSSILALFGSVYLAYLLSAWILPKFISLLITVFFSYWLLTTICRVLTFPGSNWFWKRNVENYFQNAFVKKVQKSVSLLRTLLEYLLKEVPWNNFLSEEELIQIRMMISSLLNLFRKQQEHHTLTKRQRGLLEAFTGIEKLLSQTIVINRADHMSISLWKFLEENSDAQNGLELPNALLYFKDRGQGHFLLEKCLELEDKVNQITVPQTAFKNLKRWLFEDSFGTVDQVREEIQNRYECTPISLEVEKRTRLDCVYIAGRSPDESGSVSARSDKKMSSGDLDSSYYAEFKSRAKQNLKSTVIICCPNSTYYEFLYYENEWIDIYVRNGINVFLWNYRGYGRSTGTPSLDNIKQDGEFIVNYLRKELGAQKLGAHGDSVGGIVASHIAKTQNLDFLCADRNFSSITKMGEFFFGSPLMTLYKYLMLPTDKISEDYLENSCYKVITFDAKDEEVPLLASLKYRLTSKIIEQKLNFDSEYIDINSQEKAESSSSLKVVNFVKKFITFVRLDNYSQRLEKKTRDHYDFLNKPQMLALFWAFYRISELFIPLSSLQTLPTSKQAKRPQSISEIQTNTGNASPIKKKLERKGSLDSSFNVVSKEPVYSLPDEPFNSSRRMTTDESVVIPTDSKTFNESLDWRGSAQLDDASLIQTIKKRSYMELFGEDAQASADVVNLLVKIFAVFEDLEAGGIQISDVIATEEKYRFEVFRNFMQSFEIWGSYLPLDKIIEDEPKTLSYYQQNALNKLRGFIKKIDNAIHKQKQRPPLKSHNRLVASVIEDLEIIVSIMPYFYQKLSNKIENSTSTSLIGSSQMNYSRSGQIDLEDVQQTKNVGGAKFIPLQNDVSMHSHGITDSSYLGNLLPVTSGQSGSLRQNEIEVYEYHLRNSRMI